MFETSKLPTEQRTVTGNPVSFNTHYALPLDACKISFEATQSGSGDPYPPGGSAQRWDEQWELGGYNNSTGAPDSNTDRIRCKNAIPITGGTSIYICVSTMIFFFIDANDNVIDDYGAVTDYVHVGVTYAKMSASSGPFPVPSNAVAMRFYMLPGYGTTYNNDLFINYPDTDTTYHPYSNVRPIIGVDDITLSDNGTAVFIDLDGTRYGGYVDWVGKKLVLLLESVLISNLTFQQASASSGYFRVETTTSYAKPVESVVVANILCEALPTKSNTVTWLGNRGISVNNTGRIVLTDISCTTYAEYHNKYDSFRIVYELPTPIEIPLSDLPNLSTLKGTNTFSTDTGSLEISFQDLQERTASGSVASFDTALAMPLPSCNIAVNAWQEGSGDPSPVNKRPIHGFSEVNATRLGKNLFDKTKYQTRKYIDETTGQIINISNDSAGISDYIPVKANETLFIPTKGTIRNSLFDRNKNLIRYFPVSGSKAVTIPNDGYIVLGGYDMNIDTYQLEVGSTATAYEPYVTPTIYTIQLGQNVYGAEVDVVNGIAHVTLSFVSFTGTENWTEYASAQYHYQRVVSPGNKSNVVNISSHFKGVLGSNNPNPNIDNVMFAADGQRLRFKHMASETLEDFKSFLASQYNNGTPVEAVYQLLSPFDIQLTSTQIETLIGNNTIFADSGDVNLIYKDCDLAKRGDFRQVFKIPD